MCTGNNKLHLLITNNLHLFSFPLIRSIVFVIAVAAAAAAAAAAASAAAADAKFARMSAAAAAATDTMSLPPQEDTL